MKFFVIARFESDGVKRVHTAEDIRNFHPRHSKEFNAETIYEVKWQQSDIHSDGYWPAKILCMAGSMKDLKTAAKHAKVKPLPSNFDAMMTAYSQKRSKIKTRVSKKRIKRSRSKEKLAQLERKERMNETLKHLSSPNDKETFDEDKFGTCGRSDSKDKCKESNSKGMKSFPSSAQCDSHTMISSICIQGKKALITSETITDLTPSCSTSPDKKNKSKSISPWKHASNQEKNNPKSAQQSPVKGNILKQAVCPKQVTNSSMHAASLQLVGELAVSLDTRDIIDKNISEVHESSINLKQNSYTSDKNGNGDHPKREWGQSGDLNETSPVLNSSCDSNDFSDSGSDDSTCTAMDKLTKQKRSSNIKIMKIKHEYEDQLSEFKCDVEALRVQFEEEKQELIKANEKLLGEVQYYQELVSKSRREKEKLLIDNKDLLRNNLGLQDMIFKKNITKGNENVRRDLMPSFKRSPALDSTSGLKRFRSNTSLNMSDSSFTLSPLKENFNNENINIEEFTGMIHEKNSSTPFEGKKNLTSAGTKMDLGLCSLTSAAKNAKSKSSSTCPENMILKSISPWNHASNRGERSPEATNHFTNSSFERKISMSESVSPSKHALSPKRVTSSPRHGYSPKFKVVNEPSMSADDICKRVLKDLTREEPFVPNAEDKIDLGNGSFIHYKNWTKNIKHLDKDSFFVKRLAQAIWGQSGCAERYVAGITKRKTSRIANKKPAEIEKLNVVLGAFKARLELQKAAGHEVLSKLAIAREWVDQKFYDEDRPPKAAKPKTSC